MKLSLHLLSLFFLIRVVFMLIFYKESFNTFTYVKSHLDSKIQKTSKFSIFFESDFLTSLNYISVSMELFWKIFMIPYYTLNTLSIDIHFVQKFLIFKKCQKFLIGISLLKFQFFKKFCLYNTLGIFQNFWNCVLSWILSPFSLFF